MRKVRPVEPEDLPQVAALYERVMRSGASTPPPGLAPYFERTLLRQPALDPEIPSLVYEGQEGRVLGFVGAHVRRLRFGERPLRVVWAGQLISEPEAGRRGVGAVLLRSLLGGPQDASITDGGTAEVRAMWEGLGGHTSFLGSVAWVRALRPARIAGEWLLERRGRAAWSARAEPLWRLLDAGTARLTCPRMGSPELRAEELKPEMLVEHLPAFARGARLRPDYNTDFVRWLFGEMAAVETRGRLTRRALRAGGELVGWYVAYLKPGGVSQVMQITAGASHAEAVVDRLLLDAWEAGSAAVAGRLEPLLFEPLVHRRCILRHAERMLVHSRDPELPAAVALGHAALTRMDGEWWMGHHTEPFAGPSEPSLPAAF